MSVASLNDFLTEDHRRLDEFLERFQERKSENLIEAAAFLSRFAFWKRCPPSWKKSVDFSCWPE